MSSEGGTKVDRFPNGSFESEVIGRFNDLSSELGQINQRLAGFEKSGQDREERIRELERFKGIREQYCVLLQSAVDGIWDCLRRIQADLNEMKAERKGEERAEKAETRWREKWIEPAVKGAGFVVLVLIIEHAPELSKDLLRLLGVLK